MWFLESNWLINVSLFLQLPFAAILDFGKIPIAGFVIKVNAPKSKADVGYRLN
jgi:hypothetical protein